MKKTRLHKHWISNKESDSVVFRDYLGYTLSLPNTVSSGELTVCSGVFYACNGCLPLNSKVIWENDGEYITFYQIDYNNDTREKTNAEDKS